MLCWRRISAIGTPASPCFRISTIWLSVNRDFRMGISLAPESLRPKCLPEGEAYGGTQLGSLTVDVVVRVAHPYWSATIPRDEPGRPSRSLHPAPLAPDQACCADTDRARRGSQKDEAR